MVNDRLPIASEHNFKVWVSTDEPGDKEFDRGSFIVASRHIDIKVLYTLCAVCFYECSDIAEGFIQQLYMFRVVEIRSH